MAALLAIGLVPAAAAATPGKAHAEGARVSYVGPELTDTGTYNPSGTYAHSKYMEAELPDGTTAMAVCAEHNKPTPSVGTALSSLGAVANDAARKVLWYGYEGPEDRGYGLVTTACALSNALGNFQTTGASAAMVSAVSALPSPPSSFEVTMWSTGGRTQNLCTWTYQPHGGIELDKASGNASVTDGNACYSLAGAEYGVYRDEACTDLWFSMTTDEGGHWETAMDIPVGDYWVKEIAPPKGYALDETVYPVSVSSDSWASLSVNDVPQNDPAAMWVGKIDLETTSNMPQGSASLAGAEFTVSYYGGYYDTKAEAEAALAANPQLAHRTWVVATNENGFAMLSDEYKVSGDEFYRSSGGLVTIPLGTVLIQETKAPAGYLLDDATVHVRQITSSGTVEDVETYNAPTQPEQVVRGGVSIEKIDAESKLPSELGAGEFKSMTYQIKTLNDNPVKVDGRWFDKGRVVKTITAENGVAATADDALPYGRYSIQEASGGTGYNVSDKVVEFSIVNDGEIVSITGDGTIANQIKRGDLEFRKKSEATSQSMAGIPFMLTSETTGESHIIVTDENGYASTSAAWNKHTHKTNANDAAWDGAAIDESKLDAYAGVWFGLTEEGWVTGADDDKPALPYDTYTVEELPCKANEGLQLVRQSGIVVHRDQATVDLGTIDDPMPGIATSLTDDIDGDHIAFADDAVNLTDRVTYANLIPGRTYELRATLVDARTGALFAPDAVKVEFVPDAESGYVNVPFALDLAGIDSETKLVCYEELWCEGRKIAEHKDIADAEQTVSVTPPAIFTSAVDGIDGDKEIVVDPEAVVVDTVAYENLVPNASYAMSAELVKKDGGEVVARAEQAFTAAASGRGTVDVTFAFDASELAGASELVAFETCIKVDNGRIVAEHKDVNDEGQTVTIIQPEIATTAKDGADADKELSADPEATLVDTIEYHNLVPGKSYTASGTLMDKETGEAVLDAEGNPVTASTEFVPDLPHGYVDVTFEFDASALGGHDVVVFEKLLRLDAQIAGHEEIADEGQTVKVVDPEIGTSLADGVDGDKNVIADPNVTLVDTVEYKNLVPGKTYTLNGTLMVKATNEPLTDAEGNPVTATTEFVPGHATGKAEVAFTFDGDLLAGKELVAFESLMREGVEVAVHADIDDKGQTVQITPSVIGTTATDGLDGDKIVVADAEATIVDTVAYSNVLAGGDYSLAGILMDKSTGLPLATGGADADAVRTVFEEICVAAGFGYFADNGHGNQTYHGYEQASGATEGEDASGNAEGKDASDESEKGFADAGGALPIAPDYGALAEVFADNADLIEQMAISTADFEPERAEGSVDVAFEFDASRWIQAGEAPDVVAFELLIKDGSIVAKHADLEDEGQTVAIVPSRIATTATDKSDGDHKLLPTQDAVIVDTVEYTDLIPGKEYEVQGVLMDKSTGKPLMVNDKEVTSSVKFTPNEPNGSVELEFHFDSTGLLGKEIVVFETLYKDGVEVAVHADINDENQTVTVEEGPEGTTYDKTGDLLRQYGWVLGVIALAAAAAAAYGIRQRKLAKAEGSEPKQD